MNVTYDNVHLYVILIRQDMEEGETWEGKKSGEWEKRNKKGRRNGKSIYLLGRHVTKIFLLKIAKLPMSGNV